MPASVHVFDNTMTLSFERHVLGRGTGIATPVDGSTCCVRIDADATQNANLSRNMEDGSAAHYAENTSAQNLLINADANSKAETRNTDAVQNADDVFTSLQLNHVNTLTLGECVPGTNDGVIHSCVKDMVEGQVCEVLFQHREKPRKFRLTLCSYDKGKELWEMSETEKLDAATKLKSAGNERYKSGDVTSAFRHFSRAARFLISMGNAKKDISDTSLRTGWNILSVQVWLNLAACQLQSGYYDAVVENCTRALALDERNVKAWYRRAQARVKLGHVEEAGSDLTHAQELEPSNRAVGKLLREVQAKVTARDSKMADAMRKAFAS